MNKMESFQSLLHADLVLCKKYFLSEIKAHNITSGQPKILEYLGSHGPCPQKDIALNCYIDKATLSSVLTGMEKSGLIERSSDIKDRRVKLIQLSEEGWKLARALNQDFFKTESVALTGFSEEEAAQFISYLKRIRNNLSDAHIQ